MQGIEDPSVSNDAVVGKIEIEQVLSSKKVCAFVYNKLLTTRKQPITKYREKWESMLNVRIQVENYEKAFVHLYKITDDVKLRDFQY